ncbi:cell division protein ZapA [Neoehrlichia mikurensis]|uniref:Cell division protein ZapA n=1 Tax=Neoehrlichia mikurensis TaxID=89586 RepID=A0A9Q9BYW6_9RICK|nr:cell division protein ZapA [Neoehrlichia mikurensis]QXK91782.1 cell division protein ZapA [Neoehrlichia mikurensis]QXK92995.1 cell division protein ZapA [Neoehrlichia mikurensis]QXK93472.1 cell division protein ZapA [Neoehrlichia mikurensis]UTO55573.1 cell division protein ZapA [Neoehrlichia mikurensis]UTO56494.1 cell division protein ZapA [Neoehrlichia mikurensis]
MTEKNHNKQKIVEIIIHNNIYKVACHIEEKPRLIELANKFNSLVNTISNSVKNKTPDTLIFLLAGLTLEDQIEELSHELKNIKEELSKYKMQYEQSLQKQHAIEEYVSYSLLRIEKLILYIKSITSPSVNNDI